MSIGPKLQTVIGGQLVLSTSNDSTQDSLGVVLPDR